MAVRAARIRRVTALRGRTNIGGPTRGQRASAARAAPRASIGPAGLAQLVVLAPLDHRAGHRPREHRGRCSGPRAVGRARCCASSGSAGPRRCSGPRAVARHAGRCSRWPWVLRERSEERAASAGRSVARVRGLLPAPAAVLRERCSGERAASAGCCSRFVLVARGIGGPALLGSASCCSRQVSCCASGGSERAASAGRGVARVRELLLAATHRCSTRAAALLGSASCCSRPVAPGLREQWLGRAAALLGSASCC